MAAVGLEQFIKTRNQLGHVSLARFSATMTGGGSGNLGEMAFECSLTSIDIPSIRVNTENIYFDGMPIEVYKNFVFDPDFSMTVICDNMGWVYMKFIDLATRSKQQARTEGAIVPATGSHSPNYKGNFNFANIVESDIDIIIKAMPDTKIKWWESMQIALHGVNIKTVGGLSFSSSSTDIGTFSVTGSAMSFGVIDTRN